jgi:hypothetical protein
MLRQRAARRCACSGTRDLDPYSERLYAELDHQLQLGEEIAQFIDFRDVDLLHLRFTPPGSSTSK